MIFSWFFQRNKRISPVIEQELNRSAEQQSIRQNISSIHHASMVPQEDEDNLSIRPCLLVPFPSWATDELQQEEREKEAWKERENPFGSVSTIQSCMVSSLLRSHLSSASTQNQEFGQNAESNYKLHCDRIAPSLAQELGMTPHPSRFHSVSDDSWKPPSHHGLENSSRIIPHYYLTGKQLNNIFEIDYYDIILDDIRNIRPLNQHQLGYLQNVSEEDKMNVIEEFNKMVSTYTELLNKIDFQ